MIHPRVSVITPNYNKGHFVSDCIESVRAQDFSEWEHIIVDDGSNDGSEEIAKTAADSDPRISFFTNDAETKGAAHARNIGLEKARGEYVIFLDSDDLISHDCLAERVADMDVHPELTYIVYPTRIFYREPGDSEYLCNVPNEEKNLHRFLNRDIVWLISGPIWRKSALQRLGGFDETLHSQQDYDLHVRALIKGLPYSYRHTEPKAFYRQEVDSLPRRNSQSISHFRFRYEMIIRHVRMLKENELLDDWARLLLARYLLDLAQMMRWHIGTLGRDALKTAFEFWDKALELGMVSPEIHELGKKYIRFKHRMVWNRFPRFQRKTEKYYREKLGELIFRPSKTYCRTKMSDYGG